ncbi:MAG TPA: YihY/virulence factor BrkB family protein [Acetobacteraceae bacterium]|nr:YihY/virulence factor BrkB family protein [Acetobacteraceae bacterium]
MSDPTSWPAWRGVLRATLRATVSDRVALAAAGCAFFATLALFPAMSMLISVYGLVFNPRGVELQVLWLRDLLPPTAYWLIADRLHHLVIQPPMRLGLGLGVSVLLTVWTAAVGMRSMLSALTIAYGGQEHRGFLRFHAVSLAMTAVAITGAVLAIAILVGMPALFRFVTPWAWRMRVVHLASLVLLLGCAGVSVALLYRFGPARPRPPRHWVTPGSALALALWLLASGLLSFYIDHIATFGVTYGPLGAVAAVMLWFFVTAYAVLLGAELNAQLERLSASAGTGQRALVPQAV